MGQKITLIPSSDCSAFGGNSSNHEILEGKVGRSEEREPLLHSGYDEEIILLC